ncbi:MAG: peptidylprolyl isomerase [Spirochaetales bacterium]|nr:peptidylprolyl isomerase [Spirochaetales bacterium]
MVISKDKVVTIDYTLKDDRGEVLDSSTDKGLSYLHGNGFLIPGLERALEGKQKGAKLDITVEPGDAYGEYDNSLVFSVSKDKFKDIADLETGMKLRANTNQGEKIITIKEIAADRVRVDMNHELAGKRLHFAVTVNDVRAAAQNELKT